MRKLILVFLILFYSTCFIAAENKEIVAVPTIEGQEVADFVSEACRSMIETALIKTKKFYVIDYNNLEEILKAQAFSLSGCTDDSCAVEVGKLLSAEKIVVGSLSALDEKMILTIRLVDVSTGKSINAEIVNINSVNDLQNMAFAAAYRLVGLTYIPGTEITVEETGSVYVKAPEGLILDVSIDGEPKGKAPILIEDIPFGVHSLEAKGLNYSYKQKININSKDAQQIIADNSMLKGNLIVEVESGDSTDYSIYVNGEKKEPGLIPDLPVGDNYVKAEGLWRSSKIEKIIIEAGKTKIVNLILENAGELEVFCPENSEIILYNSENSESFIIPAGKPNFLVDGKYIMKINHPEYQQYSKQVIVNANKNNRIYPLLVHTEEYGLKYEYTELERRREDTIKKNKGPIGVGITSAVLGGLSLSLSVMTEILIATDSELLIDCYSDALTDAAKKNNRIYSITALAGAGAFAILSGTMFAVTSPVKEIDKRMEEIQSTLKISLE